MSSCPATAPADFSLVGKPPLPAKLRGHYRLTLREYAPIYGYLEGGGERTIKRLVSLGRHSAPEDLPPLDEPRLMADWWRAHHPGRSLPVGIRRAGEAPRAVVAEPLALPRAEPAPIAFLDFPAQVAALRSSAQHDLHELRALKSSTAPLDLDVDQSIAWHRAQDQRLAAAQRQYGDSFDLLRKAENDLQKWELARGLLVARADVEREMTRIIGAINSAGRRLMRTVRPQLTDKLPGEQDALWEKEWRACLRILASSKFLDDAFALEVAA